MNADLGDYVRSQYNVPAYIGGKVTYKGETATIIDFPAQYLRVRMDRDGLEYTLHPTWHVEYLAAPVPGLPTDKDEQ